MTNILFRKDGISLTGDGLRILLYKTVNCTANRIVLNYKYDCIESVIIAVECQSNRSANNANLKRIITAYIALSKRDSNVFSTLFAEFVSAI